MTVTEQPANITSNRKPLPLRYRSDSLRLILCCSLPKKIYEFTADMLTDNEKKVSIDGLNTMGWSNHYDPVYNMVFIEK